MKNTTGIRVFPSLFLILICPGALAGAEALITVDTQNLLLSVDPTTCRWSAEVKGTPMRLNDVYFLPDNDPSGWKVASSVDKDDANNLGSFVTVTLRGTKPGRLDFDYRISASKTGNDILVSLGRSNNTGKAADIGDMDYFVSNDARLGGTTEKWISLGARSLNEEYYDLTWIADLVTPTTYQVNQVVKNIDTGNSLLMGHVTTLKGASRFEVAQGWTGKTPDRMQVRGYCSYKVTMPAGKSFPGEKLLIEFSTDAIRAMEHQADLIAIANDIRLKQRRPIDLEDKELVAGNYIRFSDQGMRTAPQFLKTYGLYDFYYPQPREPAPSPQSPSPQVRPFGGWGVYGLGGSIRGSAPRQNYPAECYLPVHTQKYLGDRVIDFSNPLTIKLERERAFQSVVGNENATGTIEMDYVDGWDKWPGQYDPYMSALETYHASAAPWREVIDQKSPRRTTRSNMAPIDYNYGFVDICRISSDADGGYEEKDGGYNFWFTQSVLGGAIRAFYNGRVFWNDLDSFHVYAWLTPGWVPSGGYAQSGRFNYGQAKVSANFKAFAGSTVYVFEAPNDPTLKREYDAQYPDNRIELLKRVSPPTMDVSYPVDLFVRKPAQIWNMPVERPFGKWAVLGVFNYTNDLNRLTKLAWRTFETFNFTAQLDAAKDLRLDPNKEYIVYEFWSKKLLGTFKGTFETRPLNPYDCDIYSIVEKQDRPVLISTSRHIRQMAFDIKDLAYEGQQRMLRGVSRAVAGDPYQLRIYVPDGFSGKRVELSEGLMGTMKTDGNLLTVDYKSATGKDVEWKVFF
jgi:hypothetical protein